MVKLNIFIFSFFLNSLVVGNEIITIEIDGSNLPETKGEVSRGEKIFKENCSKCHGYSAEGLTAPELVGSNKLSGDNVSKTVGNFWPYAPKIFDFIKRYNRYGIPVNIVYGPKNKEGILLPEILSKDIVIDKLMEAGIK